MVKLSVLSKASLDFEESSLYLGGPVSYAGRQLSKIGFDYSVFPMVGKDFPFSDYYSDYIKNHKFISSSETTKFSFSYQNERRIIKTLSRGKNFWLSDLPGGFFKSKFIMISPIVGDMPLDFLKGIKKKTDAKILIDPFNNDFGEFDQEDNLFFREIVTLVDFVKISYNELLGLGETFDSLKKLSKKQGTATVFLITCGKKGTFVIEEGRLEIVPTLKKEAVDTIGCGDIFCAGFSVGLLMGKRLYEAVLLGNICASLSIRKKGTESVADWSEIWSEFLALKSSYLETV